MKIFDIKIKEGKSMKDHHLRYKLVAREYEDMKSALGRILQEDNK